MFKDNQTISDLRSAFFDMAHCSFVILDSELTFCDINQRALDFLGITREVVIGENLLDVVPHIKDTERHKAYLEVLRTGEAMEFDDIKLEVYSKEYVFSIKAFKRGDNLCIAAISRLDHMNMYNELKFAQYELELANADLKVRNEELEELSYVSAHDLKAHLTNLTTLLQMLEADVDFQLDSAQLFKKVMHVSELMTAKLKALNEVISIRGHLGENKQIVEFQNILDNIQSEISEEISETGTTFILNVEKCPKIYFDPMQLHSVLYNLIGNAIKYRHPDRAPTIEISTRTIGTKTRILVQDNGLGFDNKIAKNKFFGLFKRMHNHVDGLGVGLYMVKTMVQSQGGYIEVDSEINIGTTFKLVI